MGKGRKAANDTKPIKRNCIMQSGERAVFSPRFLLLLHRTGWEFTCGWCWQHNPLGHQVSAKYRRRIVSWFCPMRRRSLRLLSPGTFLQLGRRYRNVFSGEKLPQGIFCPKTGGPNVEGIVLRVIFLKGLVKRSVLMMDFYREIWKNVPLAQENCNHFAEVIRKWLLLQNDNTWKNVFVHSSIDVHF